MSERAVGRGGSRPRGRLASVRHAFAFALLPAMGLVSPLIALPAISGSFGAAGWAAVAVGQSVGAAASVLVELGWGLTGPQVVAAASRPHRQLEFAASLKSRTAAACVVTPFAVGGTFLLGTPYPAAAMVACAAMSLAGLSFNWYFIGIGRPSKIFVTDSLPRLVSVLIGATMVGVAGAPLWAFSVALLIGFTAPVVFATISVAPSSADLRTSAAVAVTLRSQASAVAGRALSAIYIGLPVALVQASAPTAVPAFAAADRLLRMGLLILQGVPNSLQRRIGIVRAHESELRRAIWSIVGLQTAVGLVAAIFCWTAMPFAVSVLFSGHVHVSHAAGLAAGVIALLTSVSRATGLGLVAVRRIGRITMGAAVAAVWTVATVGAAAVIWGAPGGLFAVALAELACLLVQVSGLVRRPARGVTAT